MTETGKDEQPNYEERRAHPRVPLDAPFFVTLRKEDDEEAPALLVDCGRGGVQLALSPVKSEVYDWLSCKVMVMGLPGPLDPAGRGCPGTVSWVSSERCGVRFFPALTISDDALIDLAGSL